MKITMLVDTFYRGKRYKAGKPAEVGEKLAARWAKRGIALITEEPVKMPDLDEAQAPGADKVEEIPKAPEAEPVPAPPAEKPVLAADDKPPKKPTGKAAAKQ